VNATAADTAA